MTCWVHQKPGAPNLPVWVGGRDTQALLDTGSVVTLLRPDLADGRGGSPWTSPVCMGTPTHTKHATLWCRPPEGCLRYGLGLCPTSPYPYSLGVTAQYSTSFETPNRASDHIGYRHEGTFDQANPLTVLGWLTHTQQSCLEKVTGPGGGMAPPHRTPGHSTGGPHRADSMPLLDTPQTQRQPPSRPAPQEDLSSPLTEFSDFSQTRLTSPTLQHQGGPIVLGSRERGSSD